MSTQNVVAIVENWMGASPKIKSELSYDLQSHFKTLQRYLCTHVYNSTIHNSRKVEATQISIDGEMDKPNVYIQWDIIQP